jgi:hypothetical protein
MTSVGLARRDGAEISEARLIECLSALLACDGSIIKATERLREDGIEMEREELQKLRERHAGLYQALAAEVSRAQEETIAQEFRELARLGQRATHTFLDKLNADIEAGTLPYEIQRQLPQLMQALAKIQQVSVDKLLSITGRPQDGGSGDPLRAAKELMDLGILVPRDRPADIDTTAEEAP